MFFTWNLRSRYKPQVDTRKAAEIEFRRRRRSSQSIAESKRAQVDEEAERKKYRAPWREVKGTFENVTIIVY